MRGVRERRGEPNMRTKDGQNWEFIPGVLFKDEGHWPRTAPAVRKLFFSSDMDEY